VLHTVNQRSSQSEKIFKSFSLPTMQAPLAVNTVWGGLHWT